MIENDWFVWELVGAAGQCLLLARWLIQILATKKSGWSRTPALFWIITICSAIVLLPYELHLQSAVLLISTTIMTIMAFWNLNLELKRENKNFSNWWGVKK